MLRPTRSIVILFAVFLLFSTVSFLENRLQSWSHGRFSIISAPPHEPTPPPPQIVEFWGKWANVFDQAKPKTPKIELQWGASTDGSDKANGDRTPGDQSIGIPDKDVESLRESHAKVLKHEDFKNLKNQSSSLFSKTGVVIVGGGPYMPPALVSIRMLRKVNKSLPVHVFVPTKHEYEPEVCEQVLPALNAECFIIQDHLRKENAHDVKHFQLKVLAVLFSSFETVLYLDSDCMVLHDPMELISSEPFASTGMLSWPDYWKSTEDPVFYKIAGMDEYPKNVPARSSESGEIVVSKNKHLDSLILASYYNVYGPDYYYPLLSMGAVGQGDKETFLAGAIVAKNPYYRVKEKIGTVGYFGKDREFHGGAMVQWDAAEEYRLAKMTDQKEKEKEKEKKKPRAFFLHANLPKMNVGRLLDDKKGIYEEGTEKRIRLWGGEQSMRAMFGYDIERYVWNQMREIACELKDTMKDFHGRWQICRRAQEHYTAMFEPKTGDGV